MSASCTHTHKYTWRERNKSGTKEETARMIMRLRGRRERDGGGGGEGSSCTCFVPLLHSVEWRRIATLLDSHAHRHTYTQREMERSTHSFKGRNMENCIMMGVWLHRLDTSPRSGGAILPGKSGIITHAHTHNMYSSRQTPAITTTTTNSDSTCKLRDCSPLNTVVKNAHSRSSTICSMAGSVHHHALAHSTALLLFRRVVGTSLLGIINSAQLQHLLTH